MSVKKKIRSEEPEKSCKTSKVSGSISFGGVTQTVTGAKATKGGGHLIASSGEPVASQRGYRIQNETIGFRIEHFPPVFVPKGTPRKVEVLCSADWDFCKLLKEPIATKRLALFHELARESARIRLACRTFEEARNPATSISRQAVQDGSEMIVAEDFSDNSAETFLLERLREFPFGVRCIQTDAVASDTAWNRLTDQTKAEMIEAAAVAEKNRREESPHGSLTTKDVPGEKPDWPLDHPLEVADEWNSENRPFFAFNSGMPGLPELGALGNGGRAGKLLSESVDLCICYNFRDEEIIEAFTAWLKAKRETFPETLQEFKVSSERPYTKLKSNNVDAVLKGLAALRLRAAMPAKAAAVTFHEIYFPKQKARKSDIGNVQKQAEKALEWQRMFLRYCPLDSAPETPRGPWDLECSLCCRITPVAKEPGHISKFHRKLHCPECDHREKVGWDGKKWVTCEE